MAGISGNSVSGSYRVQGKVAAVAKWPMPTKAPDLRSFLGFTGYYQRFIKNYLRIVKPLHELVADVEA